MYEVKKNIRCIDGRRVETFSRQIENGECKLEVESGTNGFGKESRVYLRIENLGKGGFLMQTVQDRHGRAAGIEVVAADGHALMSLLEAMVFAFQSYDDQISETARRNGDI